MAIFCISWLENPFQGMVNQSKLQQITILISGPAEDGTPKIVQVIFPESAPWSLRWLTVASKIVDVE